jgi:hypothetical protein
MKLLIEAMEESGEQCTVVFAHIFTEPVGWRGEGSVKQPLPLPLTRTHLLAGSVTINAKTTVQCSPGYSMFESFGTGVALTIL